MRVKCLLGYHQYKIISIEEGFVLNIGGGWCGETIYSEEGSLVFLQCVCCKKRKAKPVGNISLKNHAYMQLLAYKWENKTEE